MPVIVEQQLQNTWAPPACEALDEAAWERWVEKGRAQEQRDTAARLKAVKWVAIAATLGAAVLWSQLTPFELAFRFLVAGSAIVLMVQALQARNFAVGVLFAAIAILYNPVRPAFALSADWQRAAVAATSIPFMMSLVWPDGRNLKKEIHD